jgi:hypothetical protein
MQRLRNKVFRRIKPKTLNGKHLNGQMFFELCQAYTESINKGSVPSIKSAWTNLCQNENLRAIQDSIKSYENSMTKSFESQKEVKIEHRIKLGEALKLFQSQAFGDQTDSCLEKIETEIL